MKKIISKRALAERIIFWVDGGIHSQLLKGVRSDVSDRTWRSFDLRVRWAHPDNIMRNLRDQTTK